MEAAGKPTPALAAATRPEERRGLVSADALSCTACCEGLRALFQCCVQVAQEQRRASNVAPVIRERILKRKKIAADVLDIHSLLVHLDPERNLANSYKSLGPLGTGGFGSVYRVQYIPTGEERAIKMIPKSKDPTDFARVLTEVETLARLDHPNIEKFFGYSEGPRNIFLVTELCSGGNFGDLDPAEDSSEEIRLLFQDLVAAVCYCHSEGVTHRDLKFDNCLLTKREGKYRRTAKVIDFGLSHISRPEAKFEHMRDAVGTSYFIAPEVISSTDSLCPRYGPNCDMWSIGVMLYIVYTDQHPFARSAVGQEEIIARIRHDPVRISPLERAGVEGHLKDLILAFLAKDPNRRLGAGEALAHAFFTGPPHDMSPGGVGTPKSSAKRMASLLGRVCSFAHFSRFERAVLTIVAHDAQQKEIRDLERAFNCLDGGKAGWLTRQGVCQALHLTGIRLSDQEVQTVLEALDPDGDDKIMYTDWLAATIQPSSITSERAMRELWDFFDIHSVGKVFLADVAEVLGEDLVTSDLPEVLHADPDGEISWECFQKLLAHIAANLQLDVGNSTQRWLHQLAAGPRSRTT